MKPGTRLARLLPDPGSAREHPAFRGLLAAFLTDLDAMLLGLPVS